MDLLTKIINKEEKISIIGLGYVGLPLAIEFARKYNVIGFDISAKKLEKYINGIDVTNEVGDEAIKETTLIFTNDETKLKESKFHIVAVPTPINSDKTPNLHPIISASETIGRNLTKGSIVVYESTVYPGTTEEICIPILEKESGLKFGVDFKVGYSPERINPGDKINTLTKIIKVVSGSDDETLDIISEVYGSIIEAGIYRAESIKVAEASKVIENSQRDINIAFMNELSKVFNKMDIDTKAVLKAAGTKWNFLNFTPGLVGGHCIGVDPYYFIYKAEQLGYHSQIILAGRKINDSMGKYVAENTVKLMIKSEIQVKNSKVLIMGLTFKENCSDVRNTRVIDIINELKDYGIDIMVHDPVADKEEVYNNFGIKLCEINSISNLDAIVFAVPHDDFKKINLQDIGKLYKFKDKTRSNVKEDNLHKNVLIDIKGIYQNNIDAKEQFSYWSL